MVKTILNSAIALVIAATTIAPAQAQQRSPQPRPNTQQGSGGRSVTPPDPNCPIKGNISQAGSGQSTGRRLYHVPGMQDYDRTVIDPARGERWFCTEAEAQAAGWTRAPR